MDILSQLADKYKTDKGLWHHGYTPIYNEYFENLRHKPINLFEIGVGGYEFVDRGGESLHMWADYFDNPDTKIIGLDYFKKELNLPSTVRTIVGSQNDRSFLTNLFSYIGEQNIIIDDGSHKNHDSILSFEILFPYIISGGIYVIEDTETAYWEKEYGGTPDVNDYNAPTITNYFKHLTDLLNCDVVPNYPNDLQFKEQVKSIHFYKGLIFIFKK